MEAHQDGNVSCRDVVEEEVVYALEEELGSRVELPLQSESRGHHRTERRNIPRITDLVIESESGQDKRRQPASPSRRVVSRCRKSARPNSEALAHVRASAPRCARIFVPGTATVTQEMRGPACACENRSPGSEQRL
jgi:hypothetical protein